MLLPVGANVEMSTFAILCRSNNNSAPGKEAMALTQGEDQSPHNRPGKEQGMCFLESYWPSVQFHTLLFCHARENTIQTPKMQLAEKVFSWSLRGLELTHLRNMPTPAPQVAAWAVQAPTSSPSSWLRQQELWEHSMAPQNRQRVGCFLSSSVDLGHLRTKHGGDERVEHLQQIFPLKGGDWKDFNCPLTENGWLDWGEHCNPQEDQSNDSFSWGTWRKSLLINYHKVFYYKIKVGKKVYLTVWILPFRALVTAGFPHHLRKTKTLS